MTNELLKWHLVEIKKCMNDPIYFINSYVHMDTKDRGDQQLSLWDFQENFINTVHTNRFTITKFSIQGGKIPTISAYILWKLLFNTDHVIALMNRKLKYAIDTLSVIKYMFDKLPDWMKPRVITSNKKYFMIETGSQILCSPLFIAGIKGMTVNTLYIDGLAHVSKSIADDIASSVFPVMCASTKGKIILIDTAHKSNAFREIWDGAINKTSYFIPINIPWYIIPHRDIAWKNAMISAIGMKRFNDEYEVEFTRGK